jgi:hypothetical protein
MTEPLNERYKLPYSDRSIRIADLVMLAYSILEGHAVALWLRHYATSRKVAGARPDEVNF